MVNKINEYMNREQNVIISSFSNKCLQDTLGPEFVIILIAFFCSIKTLLAQEAPPQKMMHSLRSNVCGQNKLTLMNLMGKMLYISQCVT